MQVIIERCEQTASGDWLVTETFTGQGVVRLYSKKTYMVEVSGLPGNRNGTYEFSVAHGWSTDRKQLRVNADSLSKLRSAAERDGARLLQRKQRKSPAGIAQRPRLQKPKVAHPKQLGMFTD